MEEQVRKNLGYHYTSVDAFMKMLDGIEYGKFKFHAGSIVSLNDPTEMEYGYGEVMKVLPQIEQELSIDDVNYKLSQLWNQDLTYSCEEWHKVHFNTMKEYSQYPYVISCSRNRDYLQLWNMYGNNGKGIALGLDLRIYYTERSSQDGLRILDFTHLDFDSPHALDVEYGTMSLRGQLYLMVKGEYSRYLKIVQGTMDREEIARKQLKTLSQMMILVAPFVKHNAYEGERESRIIGVSQELTNIKFKQNAKGGLTPYIEVGIPTTYLKEVVVGPCCDYDEIKKCIEIRFIQQGISEVEVIRSAIPYRG